MCVIVCMFDVEKAAKYRPYIFNQMVYFKAGGMFWGGFNVGFVSVVSQNPTNHTLRHEHGHFIQNAIFGPFMIFISIASAVRYWYRRIIVRLRPTTFLSDYYSVWFEAQANELGNRYCAYTPLAKLRGRE